jgi:colanic acid/amylovoran biosynthesis glycosyltransferase
MAIRQAKLFRKLSKFRCHRSSARDGMNVIDDAIMRVAYFTNIYPAVTHTFIRREIRATEVLGVKVFRCAVRSDVNLVDREDMKEKAETRYISEVNIGELLRASFITLLTRPLTTARAIRLTFKIGWRSDRGILMHLVYMVEAILLAYWCRKNAIQHIHAHFGTNPAAIVMLAAQISEIPYSFTAHGPQEFEKASLLSLDLKLERAKFAVCVSAFGRSQLMLWSHPDHWQKIMIVHCGLDSAFFEVPVQPPPPTLRLVCVGRLDEHKGQLVLVEAARRLRDAGVHCEIVLVGDGPMRHYIEKAIHRAGLQREITITGWMSGDRVKAEITASRAMVLPSFSENMPVVIMEALALCRPVISTYVAGIPELIQPGRTGWLVPAGDEIALSEAMRDALTAPADDLAAMGAEGRLHIIKHHEVSREALKLKSLFGTPRNF